MQKFNSCILCHASGFRIIHQKDQWKYLLCLNCGLVSLYPRPACQALVESYDDYLPVRPKEITKWKTMMKPVVDRAADLVGSRTGTGTGRLLDVGCGYGFFLEEMKSRGWEVEGVEVSRTGIQYAQDNWKIRIHPGPLENLALAEGSYDVVTLFYVIEHVHDPLGLLREVRRILKPDGLVLLRWPHSTPIVRMLGPLSRRLDLYHTPYHLYDFSPKTIERLLILSGFGKIETRIAGYTRPANALYRWTSNIFGRIGEALYCLSGGNVLFPGVSKTTLALKVKNPSP